MRRSVKLWNIPWKNPLLPNGMAARPTKLAPFLVETRMVSAKSLLLLKDLPPGAIQNMCGAMSEH
jgi:hypothetical protein